MRHLELGTPVILGNLLIIPILGDEAKLEVVPLDQGLESGARATETGRIHSVLLENPLGLPLFIMDGEELIGALQDRIAAESAVVEPKRSEEIATVCIEKGRWEGEGRSFSPGFSAFPRLRMTLTFSRKGNTLPQKEVWSLIDKKLTTLKVSSATRSMHHSFVEMEEELAPYTDWEPEEETVGVMAFSNRGFLCCDLFATRKLLRSLKEKLLKGYALDALEDRIKGKSFSINTKAAPALLKELCAQKPVNVRKKGSYVEEITASEKGRGKRLIYRGEALHTTLFPSR